MLIYWNKDFADHETGKHPECSARIELLNAKLEKEGWFTRYLCPTWQPATRKDLEAVHEVSYLEKLPRWCQENVGRIEVDTVVSRRSWDVARLAAGAVCDAVVQVLEGKSNIAFCAVRPPGHHALPSGAMGFCLLNNISIAALKAIQHGAHRVMIIDWDVHHGNGTQDVFWTDSRVAFFSMHRFPFYPGTGSQSETGAGDGLGWTLNLPLAFGTPKRLILDQMKEQVDRFASKCKPDLILVSAGFDAHENDPVGNLGLDENSYLELGKWTRLLAKNHSQGRAVCVLEGGYHLQHMPDCVHEFLTGLSE